MERMLVSRKVLGGVVAGLGEVGVRVADEAGEDEEVRLG